MTTQRRTLKEIRISRGLTQKQVADRVGVHAVTWSEYESRKMVPSGIILQRIGDVLNVNPMDIDLGGDTSDLHASPEDDTTVTQRSVVSVKGAA